METRHRTKRLAAILLVLSLIFVGSGAVAGGGRTFIRGDANNDSKADMGDVVWVLYELFLEGPVTPCQAAADANRDDRVDIADPIYLLMYLFAGGKSPQAPFPACGLDPLSTLSCESSYCPD